MQQFVVPQFIDVEDKIFGPITTRQFLILLGAGIIIFFAYRFADFTLFIATLAIVGGLALVFSFIKVNGQNFHFFLLNITQTKSRPSIRIWNKVYSKKELDFLRLQKPEEILVREKRAERSLNHIKDLALVVNTGGFYRPDQDLSDIDSYEK